MVPLVLMLMDLLSINYMMYHTFILLIHHSEVGRLNFGMTLGGNMQITAAV